MSSLTPQMARRHRHNQSADISSSGEAPRNPQNPHFYNNQVHADKSRSSTNYGQPTTPPRTPQKAPSSKIDKTPGGGNMAPGSSAKPKSTRGNNRAKNVAVTPAAARAKPIQPTGHQSSVSKPISTPNAAAYAGPTFHASPAPSALPMPSFFSKSVPESPSIKISDGRADESNSSSNDSSPPPIIKARIAEQRQKESPLDFFFNADREEKARARSANSAVGPFQPPAGPPPNEYRTPAANNQGRNNNLKFAGGSASSMFAMELDGTPGKPYGPAFSTPYSERINAARSTPSLVNSPSASTSDQQKTTDRSEALKSFLFSGQKPPAYANGHVPEPPFPGQQSPTPNRATVQQSSPSGPRNNSYSSPQQHRQNGFPYINDGPGYGSATRNTPRTSGLRQEVTPTKTPPERMDNSIFQNSPSCNFKENSARRQVAGSNLAFNNQAPPPNAVASPSVSTPSHMNNSDIRTMEDSLRRILKLEPSASGSGVSDSGIPVASASSPHY